MLYDAMMPGFSGFPGNPPPDNSAAINLKKKYQIFREN